jgi:hypothetical protein
VYAACPITRFPAVSVPRDANELRSNDEVDEYKDALVDNDDNTILSTVWKSSWTVSTEAPKPAATDITPGINTVLIRVAVNGEV